MNQRKTILICGLGQTGRSFLRFLFGEAKHSGHFDNPNIIAFDTRAKTAKTLALQAQYPQIAFFYQRLPDEVLQTIDLVWVSPGVAPHTSIMTMMRERGIPIQSDIQVFFDVLQARSTSLPLPVIGITGTNGKSTVTTLVANMLKAAGKKVIMGGNIGIPVLDLLGGRHRLLLPSGQEASVDFYVLELSSFQLHYTNTLPIQIGVLLNLAPDHLDWHADFAAYAQAKRKLLDQAAIPLDFSAVTPENAHDWAVTVATKVVEACGADIKAAQSAVSSFQPLPHRCECLQLNEVTWVNDSKATNEHAAIYAINRFAGQAGHLILLAGGVGKGQDFKALARAIVDKVHQVIVFGKSAPQIARAIADNPLAATIAVTEVANLQQATLLAKRMVHQGDTVLLSPACASFDEFSDFQARGEAFKQWVAEDRSSSPTVASSTSPLLH